MQIRQKMVKNPDIRNDIRITSGQRTDPSIIHSRTSVLMGFEMQNDTWHAQCLSAFCPCSCGGGERNASGLNALFFTRRRNFHQRDRCVVISLGFRLSGPMNFSRC